MTNEESARNFAGKRLQELDLEEEDYVLITLNRRNEISTIYSNETEKSLELIDRALELYHSIENQREEVEEKEKVKAKLRKKGYKI